MVRFGQWFAACAKRTASVGTCTPFNSTARADPVVSEVEEVVGLVAVCVAVSVEMWAGGALEEVSSRAWSVGTSWGVAVQLSASMRTHKGTMRSIPMRARVPTSPIITMKDALPVAEPHFSNKYHVCPTIGSGLPLAPCMTWW